MATEYIPNQPVLFGTEEENCSCEEVVYSQLVNLGDITQFQMKINTCYDAENIVPNGDFSSGLYWNITGGGDAWYINTGKIVKDTSDITTTFYQDILTTGYNYSLTFTVSNLTAGSLTVKIGETLNDGNLTITENGTYTISGVATDARLIFVSSTDFLGWVDDVIVYALPPNYIVSIWNDSDVLIGAYPYFENTEMYTFDKDTVTVKIDWETLGITDFGCYYLGFHDPCINTEDQNGFNFSFGDEWENTVDGVWESVSGLAIYSGGESPDYAGYYNNSTTGIINGKEYGFRITLSEVINAEVNLYIGGDLLLNTDAAGVFSGTFTGGADTIEILGENLVALDPASVIISSLLIYEIEPTELTNNLVSNTFKIGNHQCTLRINACNDEDAFGLNFETSEFSPTIRVEASMVNSRYPTKRKTETDSNGKASVIYGNRRKSKRLIIDSQPEYVHDFLSLLMLFDRFYIGSTAYFVEDDEYQALDNENEPDFRSVIIEVSEKTQLARNLNIGNEETNCSIGSNLWVDAGGVYVIDGANGSRTII